MSKQQHNDQKRNQSNFRKMREARNINLAVKFVKSAIDIGIELELLQGKPTLEQQKAHRNFWDWYFAQVINDKNLN